MALINCRECGNQISDTANSCPHCGAPLNHSNSYLTHDNEETFVDRLLERIKILVKCGALFLLVFYVAPFFFSDKSKTSLQAGNDNLISQDDWQPGQISHYNAQEDKAIPVVNDGKPVTSLDIVNSYVENEIAADQKYKGKKVVIHGEVMRITDGLTSPMVLFNDYGLPATIYAGFAKEETEKLAELRIGQLITVACVGSGASLGNPFFKDCTLITK
ncbi:OB-fold protein [Escherichia coli]